MYKQEKDPKVKTKILVIIHKKEKKKLDNIADSFKIDVSTITRTVQRFRKEGLKGLYRKHGGGNQGYLTDSQRNQVICYIESETPTSKQINTYINENFGKSFHPFAMPKFLRSLGFSRITPRKRHYKADKAKQEEWKSDFKKKSAEYLGQGYKILFEDEAIARLDPCIKKGWYRKGSKPIQLVNGLKKNVTMFGAVCGLIKILMYANRANLKNFKKFLKKLSKTVGRCVLVLDKASWHRSQKAIDYAANLGIILYFLPPYSPELNPIEQLWKWIKLNVTYSYIWTWTT